MDLSKLEAKHNIFGEELSYWDLKKFQTIEKFKDTSHDTRSLVQDHNGQFYLYDFHEEMGFPDDVIHEHYFLLENAEQGREHADDDMITLKSTFGKFIWIGPQYTVVTVG
jgi:hypothetical protein